MRTLSTETKVGAGIIIGTIIAVIAINVLFNPVTDVRGWFTVGLIVSVFLTGVVFLLRATK